MSVCVTAGVHVGGGRSCGDGFSAKHVQRRLVLAAVSECSMLPASSCGGRIGWPSPRPDSRTDGRWWDRDGSAYRVPADACAQEEWHCAWTVAVANAAQINSLPFSCERGTDACAADLQHCLSWCLLCTCALTPCALAECQVRHARKRVERVRGEGQACVGGCRPWAPFNMSCPRPHVLASVAMCHTVVFLRGPCLARFPRWQEELLARIESERAREALRVTKVGRHVGPSGTMNHPLCLSLRVCAFVRVSVRAPGQQRESRLSRQGSSGSIVCMCAVSCYALRVHLLRAHVPCLTPHRGLLWAQAKEDAEALSLARDQLEQSEALVATRMAEVSRLTASNNELKRQVARWKADVRSCPARCAVALHPRAGWERGACGGTCISATAHSATRRYRSRITRRRLFELCTTELPLTDCGWWRERC